MNQYTQEHSVLYLSKLKRDLLATTDTHPERHELGVVRAKYVFSVLTRLTRWLQSVRSPGFWYDFGIFTVDTAQTAIHRDVSGKSSIPGDKLK